MKTTCDLELIFLCLLTAAWVVLRPVSLVLFLLLPLMWVCCYLQTGHFFPKTGLDIPIILLAFLTLISLGVTPDIENSASKVLGLVLGISFYYGLVRLFHDKSARRKLWLSVEVNKGWFLVGYVLTGGGLALLGLLGADWFDKYPLLTRVSGWIPGPLRNLPGATGGFQPNAVSGTLTLFTPLTMGLIVEYLIKKGGKGREWFSIFSSRVIRWVWGLSLLLQCLWWFLAQTRGAWLGLVCGFLFLILFQQSNQRWRWLSWLIPLIPVILVYLYWFQVDSALGELAQLVDISGANLEDSLGFRLQVWNWGAMALHGFPLTGMGYNTFRQLAHELYFGPYLGDIAHAHNIWLNVGVTLGWGGIFIYLGLWIKNGHNLWKAVNEGETSWEGRAALGLLAGWYANFVFGLADTIPLGSKMGLALFLSLAVGQVLLEDKSKWDQQPTHGSI